MSEAPLVVEDVRVRGSRNSLAVRLWFQLGVLVAFGGVVAFAGAQSMLRTLILTLPLVVVALVLLGKSKRYTGERRGALRVDDREVTLDGERVVLRSQVASAWVAQHTETTTVRVQPKRGLGLPVEITVHDEETARRVVRALGCDVDQRAAAAYVRGPIAHHTLAVAILLSQTGTLWSKLGAPNGPLPHWMIPAWVVAMIAWIVAAQTSRKVTIGRDGVRVSWLGKNRFISHRSITEVERTDRGVKLHLVGGEAIDLPLRPRTKRVAAAWANEIAGLRDRIERARSRGEEGPAFDPKLLEPDDRSMTEWVRAVRSGERVSTFRDGSLDEKQLWTVVENGGVDHAQRAAAAIALSASLDDEGKKRLRVAAGASAEPKLRVALEAAADADESEMANAMQKLRRRS